MSAFRFGNGTSLRVRLLFYSQVTPSGCWEWRGRLDRSGYGRLRVGDSMHGAHRASYEVFMGPIPTDLTIDHLCRNPKCINPAHLEPVTMRENTLRGVALSAQYAVATHCVNGHRFDEENTYRPPVPHRRVCRECNRAAARRYAAKKRVERVA